MEETRPKARQTLDTFWMLSILCLPSSPLSLSLSHSLSLSRPTRPQEDDLGEVVVHASELLRQRGLIRRRCLGGTRLALCGQAYLVHGRSAGAVVAGGRYATRPRHGVRGVGKARFNGCIDRYGSVR